MFLYLGLYLLLSIIGLSAKDGRSLFGFLLIGFFLILFMGQRHEVGCDYTGYLSRWSQSHAYILNSLPFVSNEWGFAYMTHKMQEWGWSYAGHLTGISAILVACYVIFARSFHHSFAVLALLFPVIIIQLGMSGVRQALAGGFLMLAGVAFVKGKRLWIAALILIGFQFHSAVIIFLPIALLAGREVSTWRLLLALVLIAPVSAYLLADRFEAYSDRYIEQIYGERDAAGGIIRYLLVMIPVAAFLFYGKRVKGSYPEVFPLLKLFALICTSLFPLLFVSTIALHRFNYYVMPFSILMLRSSSPISSILATMPTAESTTSASITSSPLAVLTVTLHFLPLVSTLVTSDLVLISIPLFLKVLPSWRLTSSSSLGTILGRYSTIVTFVPMLW